jgi:hypothetical protein
MGLMSIDTLCDKCSNKSDKLVERELASEWDTIYTCDNCGERGVRRTWSIPHPTKESYVDGHKRGGDYALLKESARLQLKAASANGDTKKELLKAASELRTSAKKEKGKTP